MSKDKGRKEIKKPKQVKVDRMSYNVFRMRMHFSSLAAGVIRNTKYVILKTEASYV